MIVLSTSIIIFNLIAYKTVKRFSGNMIAHICLFTIAFQMVFDVFIDLKYAGFWYFTKGVDWIALPGYTVLIPPVNLMFLNWFPFDSSLLKGIFYVGVWELILLCYELITLLPEPWGFLHYGWWELWYSAFINPILLFILLRYYKLVLKLEEKVKRKGTH